MNDFKEVASEWLEREDRLNRDDRIARLEWLAHQMPNSKFTVFTGGLTSKYLFEEARYCFAYGQFIAAIILGFAYMEHTLASELYAAGQNNVKRASVSYIMKEALEAGWLTEAEFKQLDEIRTIRNPLTHFRAPLEPDALESRTLLCNKLPYDDLEADARTVITTIFGMLSRIAY